MISSSQDQVMHIDINNIDKTFCWIKHFTELKQSKLFNHCITVLIILIIASTKLTLYQVLNQVELSLTLLDYLLYQRKELPEIEIYLQTLQLSALITSNILLWKLVKLSTCKFYFCICHLQQSKVSEITVIFSKLASILNNFNLQVN